MSALRAAGPVEAEAQAVAGPVPGRAVELATLPMRRRHIRSILRIQAQHPHDGWSAGLWMAELRREGDRAYLVAVEGRHVVGYAGLLFQQEDAHVTTIGVDDRYQRRGVASRLLLELVRRARAHGVENLTLEVRSSNVAAIALYRQFGLAPAGVRKDYYKDVHEDALIMWAHEIDGDEYAMRLRGIEDRLTSGAPPPAVTDQEGVA